MVSPHFFFFVFHFVHFCLSKISFSAVLVSTESPIPFGFNMMTKSMSSQSFDDMSFVDTAIVLCGNGKVRGEKSDIFVPFLMDEGF